MELYQKIDVVRDISPSEFNRKYLKPQKPVVIKGLTENTEAGDKWSIDYFRSTMGEEIIDLYDNSKKNAASANTVPDLQMKFGEFLNIIEKNEKTDLRIFLYNMFKHNPNLKDEFPCPKIVKGVLGDIGHMFFGGKDTTVRIHYDIDMSNVLHTHFGGRKRVVLIAPEYTDMLYCLPFNTYSLIDPDKPDYKRFPALEFVKGYDFIIEPGDSVFMPSGYWHYMTYLEGGFSISYRKMATTLPGKAKGFTKLFVQMPLDKMINKVAGNNWLELKKKVATRRANWAIERAYRNSGEPVFHHDSTWFI